MSENEWRQKVDCLLKKARDQKILRGSTEEALTIFKEAEEKVPVSSAQSGLWLAELGYRKAHLLMRLAGGHPGNATDLLKEAHQLFLQSVAEEPYAILGGIYALAAGFRAGIYAHDNTPQVLKKLFTLLESSDRHTQGVEPLDSMVINLSELTAYYWGIWQNSIEGFSLDPLGVPKKRKGAWLLVGNDPDLSRVRLGRQFADAELSAILEKNSFNLAFKQVDFGHWHTRSMKSSWSPASSAAFLPLLAALLARRKSSLHQQLHEHPERVSSDNMRQQKRRLKSWLAEETGFPANEVLIGGGESEAVNPEIVVFGMVREDKIYQIQ